MDAAVNWAGTRSAADAILENAPFAKAVDTPQGRGISIGGCILNVTGPVDEHGDIDWADILVRALRRSGGYEQPAMTTGRLNPELHRVAPSFESVRDGFRAELAMRKQSIPTNLAPAAYFDQLTDSVLDFVADVLAKAEVERR